MELRICVLPGDYVGPEVVAQGVRVIRAIAKKYGHTVKLDTALLGIGAIEKTGKALPADTWAKAKASDAVLLGAVGGPRQDPKAKVRPEQGLLGLRKGLKLFANIRPVKVYDALIDASTLKPDVVRGVDLIILRELTGGAYFGKPQGRSGRKPNRAAVDTTAYTEEEVRRLMRVGFELARGRRKKVSQADKSNVMATGRLWREIAHEVAAEYPDVEYEDVLADACAMHLVRNPRQYDVIATENLFGDILSDEAAMLAGSMGMLPSASIGDVKNRHGFPRGLYEPIHGSAPDIAGKGVANPLATILSCAMMLRWSFGLAAEADAIEAAIEGALNAGLRCGDVRSPGATVVGTVEMGDAVIARV
ncbi:MAG TPA: 3-isopropylmalate dehydrogenase [Thermoflexales bacterium]|nr:3-isopropylmalate dehydrogenase [Anaerolineae bacterium]HQV27910.1 3-isopropylmalate dehydrogenase [Thermoflexales bacterium]HQY25071.1 3-isopropylmalate dehydrogenase [Thermoflexales bacterium]HQZ53980.1 3-isopropylmalate dehydrogenase [Thermoflexales bacterium]